MGKKSREKWLRRKSQLDDAAGRRTAERRSGLEKTCLFVIRWGTYLVLFTPLLVSTSFFFPFVAPKTIFFRIMVEIVLAAYLLLVISSRRYYPRINALNLALTVFLAVFVLTSFTGINLERSFWSTNERMTGIWTLLHLYAFFIILTSCFKRREDWEKFLGVSVLVGVLLSLYVLKGNEISTRGGGTIGNTSFMAAYLLFDIFFALILFSINFLKKGGWPFFWQIFSGVSLLVLLPTFFNSDARGAIVSFVAGMFLLGWAYLIFSQKRKLKKLGWGIALSVIAAVIVLILWPPVFLQDEISDTLRQMQSRFAVWGAGWQGFLERPILGWGPENFIVVFTKYYNPCMALPVCGSEVWFDRAHNIVLDTLVTTGLIGFISYLAVLAAAIWGLLKIIPKISERKNIFIPLLLAVLLIVYFFQNLLVFDMINSYLVFFLALGFAYFLIEGQRKEKEAESRFIERKPKPFNFIAGLSLVAAMIFPLWLGNIKPLIANRYLIKTLQSGYIDEISGFYQKSLDSLMNKYETREQFAHKMIRASYGEFDEGVKSSFIPLLELAESEMEKSLQENYLDFRPHLFAGQLYLADYRFSGNKEKMKRAEEILRRAVELSPTNQQGYWFLSDLKLAQGKIDEAIILLEKAVDLEPRMATSRWYLATAYKIKGDYQAARREIEKIRKGEAIDFNWNKSNLRQAIEIYQALGDDNGLIDLFQKMLKLDPENPQYWAQLAASYANLGEKDKAKTAAEKVLEINSDLAPQVEEFLKDINR